MSDKAAQAPKILLCQQCDAYEAKKNCEVCNKAICLACVRTIFGRFSVDSLAGSVDVERMKSCIECDDSKRYPRTSKMDADSCNLM